MWYGYANSNHAHLLLCTETPMIIDWSEWSLWGGCSESCGGGTRLRTRFCNDSASLATESMDVIIRCSGRTLDEEQCNMHPCPSKYTCSYIPNHKICMSCSSYSSYYIQNYGLVCFASHSPWELVRLDTIWYMQ